MRKRQTPADLEKVSQVTVGATGQGRQRDTEIERGGDAQEDRQRGLAVLPRRRRESSGLPGLGLKSLPSSWDPGTQRKLCCPQMLKVGQDPGDLCFLTLLMRPGLRLALPD